jgi:ribonuclease HI
MKITIYTDGGSRGNPGEAAVGVFVLDESGDTLHSLGKKIGIATNNEAEYTAVITALDWINLPDIQKLLKTKKITQVDWMLDSKLVVEQVNKRWKIKEARLFALANQVWKKISLSKLNMTFKHIPRSQNSTADALLNQALDIR